MSYDLANDSVWGLGIGCSGAVDIRIERVEDDPITNEWLAILERGEEAVLVTPLSGVSGRMIVRGTREIVGGLSDASIQQDARLQSIERLSGRYPHSGAEHVRTAELFYEVTVRPPALTIFGAGHDAAPVAQLAWTLGCAVTVVDVREAFLSAERFPGATLVHAHFSEFAHKVALHADSLVLVMNHHLERDRESLRFGLESSARYIGVLGPRSRYERLLAGLADRVTHPSRAGCDTSGVRSAFHSALNAAEIAIAILAEIVALRRGFEGGFPEWLGCQPSRRQRPSAAGAIPDTRTSQITKSQITNRKSQMLSLV